MAPEVHPHVELAARRPEPAAATPSPSWRRGASYLAPGSLTREPPASRNARSGRGRNHTSGPGLPGGAGRASVSSGWLCQPEEALVSGTVRSVSTSPRGLGDRPDVRRSGWARTRVDPSLPGKTPDSGRPGGLELPGRSAYARAVVWEHKTHVGDARATNMARVGMLNVGQLVRDVTTPTASC